MAYGESRYIYGIHASSAGDGWGSTGADALGGKGWVVFTEGIGHDPNDASGRDYAPWADAGLGVVVRLNNGYGSQGTIPLAEHYLDFANRCGSYVFGSQGCHVWIIGNEPNHSQERPHGTHILPSGYALCYAGCREKIKQANPNAQVLLAGPAPWNWETGDFGQYWRDVIDHAESLGGFDGVAIHVYTHGANPGFVASEVRMSPPGEAYRWHFRVYRDLLEMVPDDVPIYITEANQNDEWADADSGWVRAAFAEVDGWNKANPRKVVRCLALYRWTHDRWEFGNKAGVLADLEGALAQDYTWTEEEPDMPDDMVAVYTNHCDDYEMWGEFPQIKVLEGFTLGWATNTARPEMDLKQSPQTEVYDQDPPRSGVGFLPYAAFDWWMRTDVPVEITAGRRTKLSVALMIVAHGFEGNTNKVGDCGMIVGIGPPDAAALEDGRILWSDWRTVRDPSQPGANAEEYVWYVDETPEFVPDVGGAHIWIRCVANVAANISAGHFDLIQVWQESGSSPPVGCGGATPDQVRQIVREELANLHLALGG